MLVLFALGGEAYILYKNIFHIMGTTKPLWVPEMEIKKNEESGKWKQNWYCWLKNYSNNSKKQTNP